MCTILESVAEQIVPHVTSLMDAMNAFLTIIIIKIIPQIFVLHAIQLVPIASIQLLVVLVQIL